MFFINNCRNLCFNQKHINILKIKEVVVESTDACNECTQIIAKSINNDGKLKLSDCKMTKHECKSVSVELGDKHVIKN